ncbi:kinase-like domain-containing protein [Triangularia verruculosa]|uniref:Kinase-like domain-containing protein n=1 Tax=Triangularia verruculosa TaxID=2587418 RepID=A0AAN6XI25_9PEZI|nr:kinase-like domain-containing protein [Triangularia verruculosa]
MRTDLNFSENGGQEDTDVFDTFKTMTIQRESMTRAQDASVSNSSQMRATSPDFLNLVSLMCAIYQSYEDSLLPMQQFHRTWESQENAGNSCIVTSRSISSPILSLTNRARTEVSQERVAVKRTKRTLYGEGGPEVRRNSTFWSFLSELRVRSHPPLRSHPNIVDLKGIAWDFEDDDEDKPTPLLIEEFAPQKSLETFWNTEDLVSMPFKTKISLCRDIAEGISALHACGIAHGDIKPQNIVIFPQESQRGLFTAKLTDFGYSVFEFEEHPTLPAWTEDWSAPEASPNIHDGQQIDTFQDIKATDVYSYGLVAVSVILGSSLLRGRFSTFRDPVSISTMKHNDSLLAHTLEVVATEDRTQLHSDFDMSLVRRLLAVSLTKDRSLRSITRCTDVLEEHEKSYYIAATQEVQQRKKISFSPLESPPPTQSPDLLGYLLKACHSKKEAYKCRVCERGSRFRKILGVAIALNGHDAIMALQVHLEEHGKEFPSVDGMAFRHSNRVIPFHILPLNANLFRGLDLPTSLIRAIHHGSKYDQALHKTLDLVLGKSGSNPDTIYEMICSTVEHDESDALHHLCNMYPQFTRTASL